MDAARQDPVAAIEHALADLRHARRLERGPGGPPWMRGGPSFGGPGMHGGRGPHGGGLVGAARLRLLGALRASEGLSVSQLAEAVGVDQPRASRLVNDAAERGLVTRRADERDARRSVVQLTDAGRAMLEASESRQRSFVADALADFTPEEAERFAELFTRFVAGMRPTP